MIESAPVSQKKKSFKTCTKEFKLEALRLVAAADRPTREITLKFAFQPERYARGSITRNVVPSFSTLLTLIDPCMSSIRG